MPITENTKKTGAIYTPNALGEYMANKMFSLLNNEIDYNRTYKVLDPACGTGDLLKATISVANKLGINIEVYGFDLDSSAIETAKEEIENLGIKSHFFTENFLEFAIQNSEKNTSLFQDESILFDFCIANPPYIRTQILGDEYSQRLAKTFKLKGKIDIYQAFYASIPMILSIDGIFSVITSNKFLANKTGKSIRELLLNEFDLAEVIDLGDTKLFNAAVLPAIIIGKNSIGKKQESINCFSIYETTEKNDSASKKYKEIYELINSEDNGNFNINGQYYHAKKGIIVVPEDQNEPWSLSTIEDYNWTKKVEDIFRNKISDFGKVRVGIKTTADKVFLNQGFDGYKIEKELLHPLFSSDYAEKWIINHEPNDMKKILYPMKVGTGKRKAEPISLKNYNETEKYLLSYYDILDGRSYIKKSGREWFEIWVPQDPSLWVYNKMIWPDISDKPRFAFDNRGLYVDGNCYWFVPEDRENLDLLYLILGVCNSNFMKKYHSIRFQNKLYSNKYRYVAQYVSQYPIPNIHCSESQQIISIVKQLISSGSAPELEQNIDILLENILDKQSDN